MVSFFAKVKRYRTLLLMLLPAVLYTVIFSYLPMSGIVLAFKNYNYTDGIWNSPWCGIANFDFFFLSGEAVKLTRNTLLYNGAFILTDLVMQISVAVFLTEIHGKYFKKLCQSIMFLPFFISWVIVSVVAFNFLSYDYGMINSFLQNVGLQKVDFYNTPWIWIPILIFFNCWKNLGHGSVMYLAAIMGIDSSLYEAAKVDGAGAFQRIFHVTIPSIMPTIIILLILSVGRIFRGNFSMFYQLIGSNGNLYNYTDVIDTYTFRALIGSNNVSMAAASGLYQSVFCLAAVLVTNFAIRRYDRDYSLF